MYKAVFVDFDRTYFVWRMADDRPDDMLVSRINGDFEYNDYGYVNLPMVTKLEEYKKKHPCVTFIMLTHCSNSVELSIKETYSNRETPRFFGDCICTASAEDKVKFIKAYARACGIDVKECILVDDRQDTRIICENEGVPAIDPIEVMCTGLQEEI